MKDVIVTAKYRGSRDCYAASCVGDETPDDLAVAAIRTTPHRYVWRKSDGRALSLRELGHLEASTITHLRTVVLDLDGRAKGAQ